ncbi:hypothetical protein A9Q81_03170 [Gammaproteobacteria bacterium 42_54_T18]|nr:hypothetical protein A9Q81_03170 [Gammaproteobacteria bacterium 42_54_T18]
MKILTHTFISFFISALFSASVIAEQKIEDDNYIVHYSAINTTMLTPKVAKASGITRSRKRGMLNIAVQKKQKSGQIEGVLAQLNGNVSNLIGQQRTLEFNVITEGAAIYYLAEFFLDDGERLSFSVNVQPTPQYRGLKVDFDQTFFIDK